MLPNQRLDSARQEAAVIEAQMEEERLAGIARDRERMEAKVAEEKKLAVKLKEQMMEIKARDVEVTHSLVQHILTIVV